MQLFAANETLLENHTLTNFAEGIVSSELNGIQLVLERIHLMIVGNNAGRHGLLDLMATHFQVMQKGS